MSSIKSSEYIKKVNVEKPVLYITRLKNYDSNEEALKAFNSMKECYMVMCGDSDVQADGTAFQAVTDKGSVFIELNYDV